MCAAYARDHQPCIIFMDEIDAIGGKRFSEGTSADREIQRTLMEASVCRMHWSTELTTVCSHGHLVDTWFFHKAVFVCVSGGDGVAHTMPLLIWS